MTVHPDPAAVAARLDAEDPLAALRERFLPADGVVAYLDGNSLGRPLRAAAERMERFVRADWGTRLIRGWDEGWIDRLRTLGDRIGAAALGAAPGQVVVADSTTVLLYKLARAALDERAVHGRDEIVVDTDNFPTDRYVVEGIAAERGASLRWIESDPAAGVTRSRSRRPSGRAPRWCCCPTSPTGPGSSPTAPRSPGSRTTPVPWCSGTCRTRSARSRSSSMPGAPTSRSAAATST